MTPLITAEDLAAARLCALAANRLRVGSTALSRLTPIEREACEVIARAAIDAERELRRFGRDDETILFVPGVDDL